MSNIARVYKYPLKIQDEQMLSLRGKPLSVIVQNGNVVMYATYNEYTSADDYYIRIAGTGHPIENIEKLTFLGTIQLENGALVFHVFYRNQTEALYSE